MQDLAPLAQGISNGLFSHKSCMQLEPHQMLGLQGMDKEKGKTMQAVTTLLTLSKKKETYRVKEPWIPFTVSMFERGGFVHALYRMGMKLQCKLQERPERFNP
eukprot:scaffold279603_cov16-Tisochrysis_lutea.AAC.3